MIIKTLPDYDPVPRALATLAAHPAPVATPALPPRAASVNEALAREAMALDNAAIADAIRTGVLSAPDDDEEFEKQVEAAVKLALSVLSKQPSGVVGVTLFAAQLAGVATGIAAARANDPGLLKFAKGLQAGSKIAKGAISGDLTPAASTAAQALLDWSERADEGVTSAARYLERRPRELSAAVVDAAGALASLPPERPAAPPTAPA